MIEGAAIAWYTPLTYRQLQDAAGADTLCSYADFVKKTEEIQRGFEAKGIKANKVAIDVAHMVAWCKRHGYPISASNARSAYGVVLGMHGGALFDIDEPFDDSGMLARTH